MWSSAGAGVLLAAAGWLRPHTYAASADACVSESCAPPMGGIGLRYCLGCGTPSVITFKIPAKLPSLHSHFFFVRSGPNGDPVAFAPWQPVQLAPPTWPW